MKVKTVISLRSIRIRTVDRRYYLNMVRGRHPHKLLCFGIIIARISITLVMDNDHSLLYHVRGEVTCEQPAKK